MNQENFVTEVSTQINGDQRKTWQPPTVEVLVVDQTEFFGKMHFTSVY